MNIGPGIELLHYTLVEKLGEGGMGVVWRATDTSLGRDVAVKLLPEALAAQPERLARFEREAKLLASLNHPNIAAVYGLHEAGDQRFLVMELVPGEDLAARLARGAMSLDEAVNVAGRIAAALETAHEQGVIHRDLKPANIRVTPDGDVKVLDFGLAKAFDPDPVNSQAPPTLSPTLTSAGSVAGMILGTAAYMAPEQARGQAVDKRADVWAFGCVLYEMLTGQLAFPGETVSDTLAGVLKSEPDWEALPPSTPAAVRRLLERCLDKDPRRRLRDVGEARIRLEAPLAEDTQTTEAQAPAPATSSGRRRLLPWTLAAVAAMAAVAAALGWMAAPRDEPQVMRFKIVLDDALNGDDAAGSPFTLSPDGRRIAYVAGYPGRLYVRRLGDETGSPLSGSEGASQPFFSPDGEWIAFFAGGEMKKVSVHGGAPITLAEVQVHRGGWWGEDDNIVYAPHVTRGLFRVPAAGGDPVALTHPEEEEQVRSHRWPQVLPGGRGILMTVQPNGSSFDDARIEVLDPESGTRSVVAHGGSFGRYVPSGHVIYVHESTLFAVPFDLGSLEPAGGPVPVLEGVRFDPRNGGAQLDVSPQGHLIYASGSVATSQFSLIRASGDGSVEALEPTRRTYESLRLSPGERRLVVQFSGTGSQDDLWIYDLERGAMTRLTFSETYDMAPVWSPDGRRVVFSSLRGASVPNLHWKPADGSGESERLTESKEAQFPTSVSPDGKHLLFHQESRDGWDVLVMDLETRLVEPFLKTEFAERNAEFSRDGRWVAYQSDESGEMEIYVRPFPPGGGKWQVSTQGGAVPSWTRDGRRLLYMNGRTLMSVPFTASGTTFQAGAPEPVLEGVLPGPGFWRRYDTTEDGTVYALGAEDEDDSKAEVSVYLVAHWLEGLRAL